MTEPEEMLLAVTQAIGDAEEGRPVDFHRLRAQITASADQLRGMSADPRVSESGQSAGEHLAVVTEALRRAVDRMEADDVQGARKAVRDALWAPSGRQAPENP